MLGSPSFGLTAHLTLQGRFCQFYVPVAQFMPDKMVYCIRSIVEPVRFKGLKGFFYCCIRPYNYPAVGKGVRELGRFNIDRAIVVQVHHGKSCSVPYLVGKVSVTLYPILRELYVPTLRSHSCKCKP